MKKFDIMLSEVIFSHTDNLSKTLQKVKISAAEGQKAGKWL